MDTMNHHDWLAERFETSRPHLRAVAYSMLGSQAEAEDAVQEAWLRLSRADDASISDLQAWLTTVVGRICLDALRTRRSRREDFSGERLPEPIVRADDAESPEHAAVVADSIGMALLIVLDTLDPAERLAFVLHDVFGMKFDEIARVVGRSPQATRKLASRARSRVRNAPAPDADLPRQRRVVDAFLAAARDGDFEALVATLATDVVIHIDRGPRSRVQSPTLTGATIVGQFALANAHRFLPHLRPVTVNGAPGVLAGDPARPIGVAAFTVSGDRIARIDIVADPDKLHDLTTTTG
jgi:RNA polymerase sigma-70 factor, ECF subfamily